MATGAAEASLEVLKDSLVLVAADSLEAVHSSTSEAAVAPASVVKASLAATTSHDNKMRMEATRIQMTPHGEGAPITPRTTRERVPIQAASFEASFSSATMHEINWLRPCENMAWFCSQRSSFYRHNWLAWD